MRMALVRRRGIIQSEKSARKRRKKTIFVAVLFFVAIAAIIAAVFFFFRAGFLQIKTVTVSGPVGVNGGVLSMVPAPGMQATIEKDLTGSRLFLFSKNTLFFYPKDSIRAELMNEYPAIASLDFNSSGDILGFGNNIGLNVLVTERSPSALACSDNGYSCFYMDSSGFVYASAPEPLPGNFIRYSLQPSAVSLFATSTPATASSSSSTAAVAPVTPTIPVLAPGEFLVDQDTLATAKEIIGAVSGMGLNVVADDIGADAYGPENQITIVDPAPADLDTADADDASSTATSTVTTLVYFNQAEPLDTELNYFTQFWQSEATSSDVVFEYIDLRYGKDIVYKLYPTEDK
jgi:hypothetical protein